MGIRTVERIGIGGRISGSTSGSGIGHSSWQLCLATLFAAALLPALAVAAVGGGAVAGGGVLVEEQRIDPPYRDVPVGGVCLARDGDHLAAVTTDWVILYERRGDLWVVAHELVSPTSFRTSHPGACAVALAGDVLAVGSPNLNYPGKGAAAIWEYDGAAWTQTAFLQDAESRTYLGQDVAVGAGRVVVGVPGKEEVRVYEKIDDVWTPVQVLTPHLGASNDFGEVVSLSGSRLLVADPQHSGPGYDGDGIVYHFEDDGSGYQLVQTLQPTDENTEVGSTLLVDGDHLFIADTQSVFYYRNSGEGFTLRQEVSPGFEPKSLDLEGETLLVGGGGESSVQLLSGGLWFEDAVLEGGWSVLLATDLVATRAEPVRLHRLEGGEWVDRGALPGSSPPRNNMSFALGVAIEDDMLAVATPYLGPITGGSVSIYRRLGASWQLAGELADRLGFGGLSALAIDGERVLIGSQWYHETGGNYVGRADIAEPEGSGDWAVTRLSASAGFFDVLGTSVAVEGDIAVVGMPGDDGGEYNSGSAYVFERSLSTGEWIRVQELKASDTLREARFGQSVAIAGKTVIVGASSHDEPFERAGAVYVFERTAASVGAGLGELYTELQKIVPSDSAEFDAFGIALATAGDRLAIGANEVTEVDTGSAYVFERPGPGQPYAEVQRLVGLDNAAGDRLGRSLVFMGGGERLAVGAPKHDAAESNAGAVYVFEESGGSWTQLTKLTVSDARSGDELGEELAAEGHVLVAGLPLSDQPQFNAGRAYSFTFFPPSTAAVDLSITLADDADPVASGGELTYTATVTNAGAVDAPDAAVTFELGPALTAVATSGCDEDPLGFPYCTIGAVAAGASPQVQLTVKPDPLVVTEVSSSATVVSSAPSATPLDDVATETTSLESRTDLQLALSSTPGPLRAGQASSYVVTVTAAGPSAAREAVLDLQLPGAATFAGLGGCLGGSAPDEPCQLGWLEPGVPKEITVDTLVPPGAVGPLDFGASGTNLSVETSPGDESVAASTAIDTAPWSSFVEVLRQGIGGVDGLLDPEKVSVSGDGSRVFVVGGSTKVAVFERQFPGCGLTFVDASSRGVVGVVSNAAGDRVVTASSPASLAYYAVEGDGRLTLLDTVTNGADGVTGLDGITDLALSGDTLAVSTSSPGALLTFGLDADGVSLDFRDVAFSNPGGLSNAQAVEVAGERAFIAEGPGSGETSVVNRFGIDALDDSLSFDSVLGFFGWAVDLAAAGGKLFAANPSQSRLYAFDFDARTAGSFSGPGTGGVSGLALDPSGELIYTASPDDDALGIFVRTAVQDAPSPAEVRLDGVGGVDGLAGAADVAVAPTADCVYVVSDVEDALAVFEIDIELPAIFGDGFELGDTSAWSSTEP